MEDCIFCKIVKGEIPSMKVYEDDTFMAFMDIFPRVKGHTLVIPKKHYQWVYDVPEFGAYWETAKKVSMAVKEVLQADFITYMTIGEAVPHAHIHILPQESKKLEGFRFTDEKKISKEEIQSMASQVSEYIKS